MRDYSNVTTDDSRVTRDYSNVMADYSQEKILTGQTKRDCCRDERL